MKVLGIETSCDETAICLIESDGEFGADFRYSILGNALISQAKLHEQFGGVFPNLAKREHAKNLVPLLKKALGDHARPTRSNIITDTQRTILGTVLEREPELLAQLIPFLEEHGKPDIDALAVTYGPGLEPALWVGINFAKALSAAWGVPLVAVNHMEGHVVIAMVRNDAESKDEVIGVSDTKTYSLEPITFPIVALLISGGHTELVLSKAFGQYEVIGETRDDAAGEAFDKVARLLGLPYPGGPEISRLAAQARKSNEVSPQYKLPRPMLHEDNFDFSFSGLKTAVRKLVEGKDLNDVEKMQIAREFEDAVADVLVHKTLRAAEEFGVNTVVVGGGVSANTFIRHRLAEALAETGNPTSLLIPPPAFATDNALMIALAGYFHAQNRYFANPDTLRAVGNLRFSQ